MNQFKLTGNSSYIRAFSYDQIKLLSSEILLNKWLIFFSCLLICFSTVINTTIFDVHAEAFNNGVISIIFDDNYANQLTYAWPLIEERGIVGTFYVLTNTANTTGYISYTELQTLQAAGNEIASHSVTHTNFASLTDQQIRDECSDSKAILESNGLIISNFAYPGGVTDNHIDSIVDDYYTSGRTAYIPPYIVDLPANQFRIPVINEENQANELELLKNMVDQVYNTQNWGIFLFHNIIPEDHSSLYTTSQEDFEAFLDYILAKEVTTRTVNQVLTANIEYLLVRGTENQIWYTEYDSPGEVWREWANLPGSTIDTPAAAILDDQLHVVVRGMDGSTLWHGYYDLVTEEFFGWTMLAGSSPSPPVLTSNGTMLCLVVRGMDDLIYYRSYQDDTWGSWQLLPDGTTIDSPAAALLGNELHVVVRGMEGNSLWHKIVMPEGSVVQEWNWIPGASASPPILTASQPLNELYMFVRGADDGIYYTNYDATWGSWTSLQGLTTRSPSATISKDELHVVVCGSDGASLWHGIVDLENSVFGGWGWISGSTPSASTLTS